MVWQYTRRETKTLLVATMLMFSGLSLMIAAEWRSEGLHHGQTANTVGVFLGVEENEYNTLATQLDQRSRELDAREALLLESQAARATTDQSMLFLISVVGLGLLGLILINFYLDAHRRRYLGS